jgi:hypothetical protein
MTLTGELVFKSYRPLELELSMLFVRRHYVGKSIEQVEIFALTKLPKDKDEFISINGHPVELYVMHNEYNATEPMVQPEQIGWFDEGPDTEDLHDITLKEINTILNHYGGYVDVEVDEDYPDIVVLAEGKAILSFIDSYVDEDEDDTCENCGSDDLYYNSSGDISCNNCGYEDNDRQLFND